MDRAATKLFNQFRSQAEAIAASYYKKYAVWYSFDEMRSEAYVALVACCVRWPVYCEERGYDPARTEYFGVYASRRINGQIKDLQRLADPYSRQERAEIKEAVANSEIAPTFVQRGVRLASTEEWDILTNSSAAQEESIASNPEDALAWLEICNAALTAYKSLAHYAQLAIAYVMLKDPTDPMGNHTQRLSAPGVRFVVQAGLDAAIENAPDVTRVVPNLTNPDFSTDIEPYLASTSQTPAQLIQEFSFCLKEDPGMLVDMTKRSRVIRRNQWSLPK